MAETTGVRVAIADDHPVFRDGLALLLEQQEGIQVVGTAGDGNEALALCLEVRPDVILIDLRMAGMDGLALIGEVTKQLPTTRSIVLSGFDADEDVYQAVRAGAAGYLLKDAAPAELASAIHAVHRGERFIPPALATKLMNQAARPHLTPRQEAVLRLIAEGLSNQEIASRLDIVEGTVKVHVKSILAKLGARDRTQAVSVALQRGLVR